VKKKHQKKGSKKRSQLSASVAVIAEILAASLERDNAPLLASAWRLKLFEIRDQLRPPTLATTPSTSAQTDQTQASFSIP
jgi:hypothetical protein